MLSKNRLLIAVLVISLLVGILSVTGLAAPRKVTFWSYAANNIEEWKARKAEIDKKFNIDLQIVQVPQNGFVQKLQATMMDGKGYPDIMEWMIEQNQILNADPKKCFVLPLDKYVQKSEVYKQVLPARAGFEVYGGHVYGLPHDVNAVAFVYNDTIWKSVGVDLATIETWDEFFEAAQKLTAEKKDGKPIHYALPTQSAGLADTMWMIWQQTGAQVLDKNGKPIFENTEFKAYIEKWVKWYNTGVFCAWDWGGFPNLLASGTLAAYASPDWWVNQCYAAADEGKYKFKVRNLPVYKKGGTKGSTWGGTFLAVDKLAKNPDQLYKIIEYMQYDELSFFKYRFPLTQMIPPISSQWNNPTFSTPDPHFGGQKLGQVMIESAKNLPVINVGDIFWDAVYIDFNNLYPNIQNGKISVAEGLKQAQELAMKRLK